MRIGILGGVFDPVHYGHLSLAEQAREELSLEKIIFIPSFISPFGKDSIPSFERYKMLRLAIENNPFFEVSPIEIKQKGVSYSIDTARKLKKKYKQKELFFILGSDTWNQFSSWKDSRELIRLLQFAIIERKGFPLKESDFNGSIVRIYREVFPICSSQIRGRIKQNMSIRYLVPEKVRRYILKKKLYK
ncbi:MAG: nicotinate-nucleotide adenylyltransferase [Candidatus Omnitrophica bacterium]|nr:nicotinate-nucleotide adenylyltransferase [Candidatus Omnitrophota bacterium]